MSSRSSDSSDSSAFVTAWRLCFDVGEAGLLLTFDLAKREGPINLAQDEEESQAEKTRRFPHLFIIYSCSIFGALQCSFLWTWLGHPRLVIWSESKRPLMSWMPGGALSVLR